MYFSQNTPASLADAAKAMNKATDSTPSTPDVSELLVQALEDLFAALEKPVAMAPKGSAKAIDIAGLFNKAFPTCNEPGCEACDKRRVMAGGKPLTVPEPSAEVEFVFRTATMEEETEARANGNIPERLHSIRKALDDAGSALGVQVDALRLMLEPGSVGRDFAEHAAEAINNARAFLISSLLHAD